MSTERKGGRWPQLVASAAIGGSAVFAGLRFGIDKLIVDSLPDNSNMAVSKLLELTATKEAIPTIVARLPLEEESLDPEIMAKISQNLVIITRNTRPEYTHHVASGAVCSGFLTRSLGNYPVVVTAHHCVPPEIVSAADGKTYGTKDAEDFSIFYVDITDISGKTFSGVKWFFYSDPIDSVSSDITKIRLNNENEMTAPPLALNIAAPNQWETYYVVRKSSDNKISAVSVRYIDSPSVGEYQFIGLGTSENVCFPGTSGSAIVNQAGEIVSMITNSGFYTLTLADVQELNLDPIHIGRVVSLCIGPSAERILNLNSE